MRDYWQYIKISKFCFHLSSLNFGARLTCYTPFYRQLNFLQLLFKTFQPKVSPWWNTCKKLGFKVCNPLYREPVAPCTALPLGNRKSSVPSIIVPSGFSVSQSEKGQGNFCPSTSPLKRFNIRFGREESGFKLINGECLLYAIQIDCIMFLGSADRVGVTTIASYL